LSRSAPDQGSLIVLTLVSLAFGTLVSEDLACITAGLLIQRGQISVASGILACTVGIFAGDVGLWAVGRLFGRAALAWPWMRRRLQHAGAEKMSRWLHRHSAGAIVSSRFLPGTRLPLYVTAGVLKMPGPVFAVWTLVAALLWTPALVLVAAGVGDGISARMSPTPVVGWALTVVVVTVVLLLLQGGRHLATSSTRARVAARLARWSRWEFWPMWLFYAPVAVWVAWLSLRHRGLSTITAANPGMPDGGTVGESKFEILAKLPADCIVPSILVPAGATADRLSGLEQHLASAGWRYPLVLKPDVGQRGVGVKMARTADDVSAYLSRVPAAVVVQPFHPGPYEAGVFYYRMPGWARGRILSVTDKHFPVVAGDGMSTLEQLIRAHTRYRLQADLFVTRHRDALPRVLAVGERFQLAIAGNHAQGTVFRDGRHLITRAIERRIDDIARTFPGFCVGRFDIRYSDVERFKAGRDLAIVELNGATSESTNIYDPDTSLLEAYRQLFRQWSIVFTIGAANRERGAAVSSTRRLCGLVHLHLSAVVPYPISD
jgi:membrane protein DedA with SNARE-associated domain